MPRDPRVEPRAGDVVENAASYTCRVGDRHKSHGIDCVHFYELTRGMSWQFVMTIEEWRQKFFTATIIHVAEG